MRRRDVRGFTLLEVLVAVAILGVAMASIFSSEASAIRVGQRARTTTVASLLARCKMGEIEEHVAKEGLPAVSESASDRCCEGAEADGFECDWRVERIVLPEPEGLGEEEDDSGEDLAGMGEAAAGGDMPSLESMMAGGSDEATDAIGNLAMEYAYPIMKPSIEEQVRRAVVTVRWGEGESEKSFDVVQYLVAEQPNVPDEDSGGEP